MGYFREVLDSRQLGCWREGGIVTRFEQAYAKKVGCGYAVARNSGAMSALAEAVSMSGAGTALEVICDPMVQFGAIATIYFNSVPRFADVDRNTYLMDPASFAPTLPTARAVIVTNLWGMCANLDEIRSICDEHNLFMIEDCAHSIGSTYKGRHSGTIGDVGCFSFQQGKHMTKHW